MSFDLAASLRRLKPEKQSGLLSRRRDVDLPFLIEPISAGQPLLLDTTVYIDGLKRRLPEDVEDLLLARQINHSAVALAELVHTIGRLDPRHPQTKQVVRAICRTIDNMPTHRVFAPNTQSMLDAGILTGTVARLLGLASTDRQPFFNDAVLFAQALERGWCFLSRNVADLDRLLQLVPRGRVLLYRQTAREKTGASH